MELKLVFHSKAGKNYVYIRNKDNIYVAIFGFGDKRIKLTANSKDKLFNKIATIGEIFLKKNHIKLKDVYYEVNNEKDKRDMIILFTETLFFLLDDDEKLKILSSS